MKVVQFTIPVAGETSLVTQEDTGPYFYDHVHRHPEIQLQWIIEGEGLLVSGNFMERFQPGDLYVIGANQAHVFKCDAPYFEAGSQLRVHSISIFLSADGNLDKLFQLPEMVHVDKFLSRIAGGLKLDASNATQYLQLIRNVHESRDALRISALILLLHSFSYETNWKVLSSVNGGYPISEGEGLRMDHVFQFVLANYRRPIDLAQISDVANLTPQAFCRYFKKHTGKTFVNFLNGIRVNEACKIILSENYESISEIAYQTGFENVTNFNRVFKKIAGKAPREYQREFVSRVKN